MSKNSKKAPTIKKSRITIELIQIDDTTQHLLRVNLDAQANNETIMPKDVSIIDIAIIIISKLFV